MVALLVETGDEAEAIPPLLGSLEEVKVETMFLEGTWRRLETPKTALKRIVTHWTRIAVPQNPPKKTGVSSAVSETAALAGAAISYLPMILDAGLVAEGSDSCLVFSP